MLNYKKKIVSVILISSLMVLLLASNCFGWWTEGTLSNSGKWYYTSRSSSAFGTSSWNYGANLIDSSNNDVAGIVCLDFGYNYNSGNDYAYSYCLDKYESHIASIRQKGGSNTWIYDSNGYTYGTSLSKKYHVTGGVDYSVDWVNYYPTIQLQVFQFES